MYNIAEQNKINFQESYLENDMTSGYVVNSTKMNENLISDSVDLSYFYDQFDNFTSYYEACRNFTELPMCDESIKAEPAVSFHLVKSDFII